MKLCLPSVLALTAFFMSATDAAQADDAWYVRADAGATFNTVVDQRFDLGPRAYNDNWAQSLAFGRSFDSGLRAELEISNRENDSDAVLTGPPSLRSAPGSIRATALMLNGYWDFNKRGRLQPYVGGGLGLAQVDVSQPYNWGQVNADDIVFAYQVMGGIAYKLSPNLTADVGYRYFAVPDAAIPVSSFGGFRDRLHYRDDGVFGGLRWRLGAGASMQDRDSALADPNWYVRADIGRSFDVEQDFSGQHMGADHRLFEFDDGLLADIGLGYQLRPNLRIEGEFAFRNNELDSHTSVSIWRTASLSAWSAMLNVYRDFNINGRVKPYVGIGAGAATRMELHLRANEASGSDHILDVDATWALQGMVGASVPLSDRLTLDVGYRYFTAPRPEWDDNFCRGDEDSCGFNLVRGPYTNQTLTAGLRWRFNPPPR